MNRQKHILITGGAGFIGSNLARYFLEQGGLVTILDNFSRPGVKNNALWLKSLYPGVRVRDGSVTDFPFLKKATHGVDVILHLAGQTAVTSSVEDPRGDFEANTLGTFNTLEAARLSARQPLVVYASTNKVYGKFKQQIKEEKTRYRDAFHPEGVFEEEPLEFHSPYGCSKGASDQYTLDYGRIYGLPTVVLRQSCIYGQRQFGIAGQGWIAYITHQATLGKPVTIFGSGKQVRDVLYISDLVRLYDKILRYTSKARGNVFNVGGGIEHTLSLLELIKLLERKLGKKLDVNFEGARPGDQEVYVSCLKKVKNLLDWEPRIGIEEGIDRLIPWVKNINKV